MIIFDLDGINIIPINWGVTRYFTITFEGWDKIIFDINNAVFNELNDMASKTFKTFVSLYIDMYAFTEPELIWLPNGKFQLRIGTLEIEEYERRKSEKPELSE